MTRFIMIFWLAACMGVLLVIVVDEAKEWQKRHAKHSGDTMRHAMDERRTVIAIMDNNPCLRELYSLELSDAGYEVYTTSDIESAGDFIAVRKPDLALIDPHDGNKYRWDILGEIRERYVQLPVLICLPLQILPDDYLARYADSYIIKSFDISGLVLNVQSLLAMKSQAGVSDIGQGDVDTQINTSGDRAMRRKTSPRKKA